MYGSKGAEYMVYSFQAVMISTLERKSSSFRSLHAVWRVWALDEKHIAHIYGVCNIELLIHYWRGRLFGKRQHRSPLFHTDTSASSRLYLSTWDSSCNRLKSALINCLLSCVITTFSMVAWRLWSALVCLCISRYGPFHLTYRRLCLCIILRCVCWSTLIIRCNVGEWTGFEERVHPFVLDE